MIGMADAKKLIRKKELKGHFEDFSSLKNYLTICLSTKL